MATYKFEITKDHARGETIKKMLEEKGFSVIMTKVEPPKSRADRLAVAESLVSEAASIVEELRDEMEEWQGNLPENLQSSDKASQIEDAISNLDSLQSELEGLDFGSIEFPGMY
jgi:hypothetical protein